MIPGAHLDHVGLAVDDLEAAVAHHTQVLGLELLHREVIESQGVEAVLLHAGESHVELLAPLGPDTPVGRFVAARGPGLHHVAYAVPDVAAALETAVAAGLRAVDAVPRPGIRDSRVAFLHPASTGGVLTELVQPSEVHV